VCAVTIPLHSLYEFDADKTATAVSTRVPLLEPACSAVCLLRTIWYWLHFLHRVFGMHLIGFQCCATRGGG